MKLRLILIVLVSFCILRMVDAAEFNVLNFGANPEGKQDSSSAFNAMFAAVGEARNVQFVLPAGRYLLKQKVTYKSQGNTENFGLKIQGAGEDTTEIWVDNPDGGLKIEGVEINRLSVTISDLSVVALCEPAGTALEFDTANPGDHHARQFSAENILIRGKKFDKGCFTQGLVVRNAWYPRLQNVKITSLYGPASERDMLGQAILLEDCYSPLISQCYVWGSRDGLTLLAVNKEPEDGIIADSYFVGCVNGIIVNTVPKADHWEEPALHVRDCHINYRDYGLIINGVRQANVTNCLFYCHDNQGAAFFGGGEPRDFTPVDIDLKYASDIIISGNHFTEPANPRRIAVHIGENSGWVTVTNNQFNLEGVCVRNESVEPSFVSGNVYGGRRSFAQGQKKLEDLTGAVQRTE